jgi:hypothetical protein
MRQSLLALTAALILALPAGRADPSDPGEEKGTYLGALISAVPEVLYDQIPDLPRNQGVMVTHVLAESPAAQAGLRRHDVLLEYNDDKIRDCEHFARLIRADRPDHKVKLGLLRAGRKESVEATLALGPVLKIVQANRAGSRDVVDVPRGTAKSGAPPSVSVAATPLDGGKLRVTIEYYQDGTGRLRTVTCEGTPSDIALEVQKLPARVKSLADVALDRIRARVYQETEQKAETAPAPRVTH